MNFLKNFKTRWDKIPGQNGFRLLCSNAECSLSCANLRSTGKISVTSVHGDERHSYELTKNDMLFSTIMFLNSLSEKELRIFCDVFNKTSEENILDLRKI